VELVSGCRSDEAWLSEAGLSVRDEIFSIPSKSGKRTGVSIAFTAIADETQMAKIEQALYELNAQELPGICIRFMMEHSQQSNSTWIIRLLPSWRFCLPGNSSGREITEISHGICEEHAHRSTHRNLE